MKKATLLLIITVFIQSNILLAQNYTVVYERKHKPDLGNQLDKIKDPIVKKQIESQLIKVSLYELLQKGNISTFSAKKESKKQTDKTIELQGTQTKSNVNVIKLGGKSSTILYKDLKNKSYLKSTNMMGKDFLIKDTLPKYQWELLKETKAIGNYVCQKATTVYNNQKITAWYTPSIPTGNGPDQYYGLPGLIIELANSSTTYSALSIKETPDIVITKPSKGKEVSNAKYQKLKTERLEALKQQYKN